MVGINDLLAIGSLIVLEGLLSGDNALVLAVLVKHLQGGQRQKALFYGIIAAFVLRFLGLASAVWFIRLWYMSALGGLYLVYLAVGHFVRRKRNIQRAAEVRSEGPGFWRTVCVVVLVDFAFSMDSILVAVAVSDKLWVVIVAGCLGILLMRVAAGLLVNLLEKYPSLEDMAYALVGWASVKMLTIAYGMFSETVLRRPMLRHLLPEWLFWAVMGLIVVVGVLLATRRKAVPESASPVGSSKPFDAS
jgi:YkoY family integral membrane protein